MSYTVCIHLSCTNCNAQGYLGETESVKQTRKDAADLGWVYKRVPNGSFWDFCPRCVARGKHQ